MAQVRVPRSFVAIPRYAAESSAPTLEQVQAEAAPLVAQLLAQVLRKREQQKKSA
jgi:hypothetical protein